ncbi:MAG TPA: hypothetical protein VGE07_00640 [Herpetosiphonaceae bacterium]
MELPRGVTGFWQHGGEALSSRDIRPFKALAHSLARAMGAQLAHWATWPDPGRNYAAATFRAGAAELCLLGHQIHPLAAWAAGDGSAPRRFLDLPAWDDELRAAGLAALPAAFLEAPVEPIWLAQLDSAELRQIRHWRPQRMGDLVFNEWD